MENSTASDLSSSAFEDWIDEQGVNILRAWLKSTSAPMAVSLPGGEILWVNPALESMLGYSLHEMQGLTWTELTSNPEENAIELNLAEETAEGKRIRYTYRKSYKTKFGQPIPCVSDVLRYPQTSQFECLLVFILPLSHGYPFVIDKISEIHTIMEELIKHQKEDGQNKVGFNDIGKLIKNYPKSSLFVGLLLAILLFGERVIQIIEMLR